MIRISVPRGAFRAYTEALREEAAKQISAAVAARTRALEKAVEAQIAGAGLGKFAKTVQSRVYPPGKPSIGASGLVWSKAKEVVNAFAAGVTIQGKGGGWLAIPTPEVAQIRGFSSIEAAPGGGVRGVGPKRARISPQSFQAATGLKLDFVYTGKGTAFLVARGVAGANGKGFRPATKGRLRRGAVARTFVAFILRRQVTLRRRLDIPALLRAEQPQFREAITAAIAAASTKVQGAFRA